MGFDPRISSRLKALANKKESELQELEIYLSHNTKEHLEALAKSITEKKIVVNVVPRGDFVAFTNGNTITINCMSGVCRSYATLKERWIAFMGLFYHEISHIVFLDFEKSEQILNTVDNGTFYGKEPATGSQEDEDALQEMKEAMSNTAFRPVFGKVFHDLENIIADKHDEDRLMEKYRGMVPAGIVKVRDSLLFDAGLFDETESSIAAKEISELSGFYEALLTYSRFGMIPMKEDLWQKSDVLSSLSQCQSDIDFACWTDSMDERFECINNIAFTAWKYIKKELDKVEDRQQGQNSQQNPLEQAISEILKQLNSASSAVQQSSAPKGSNTPATQEEHTARSAPPQGAAQHHATSASAQKEQPGEQSELGTLNDIRKEMGIEKAEKEFEAKLNLALDGEIKTVNMATSHKNVPLYAKRDTTEGNKQLYAKIMKEVGPYSKKLQNLVLELLRDQKNGGTVRHKPYGTTLEIRDTYRLDSLCYSKKKLPQDLPDMAVSILVDNSGSMCRGTRIDSAITAAVLLYDFATSIGIPVSVAGHTTSGNGVVYTTFADYERVSDKDRYRICDMEPDDCNRDGMAINIAADLLMRRQEEIKILFIISDGKPNHDGYGGKEAEKDIQSIIRRYKNLGIETIAAGIGDDRKSLRPIYGDAYLDIADIKKLPKTAAGIIKKRVLSALA